MQSVWKCRANDSVTIRGTVTQSLEPIKTLLIYPALEHRHSSPWQQQECRESIIQALTSRRLSCSHYRHTEMLTLEMKMSDCRFIVSSCIHARDAAIRNRAKGPAYICDVLDYQQHALNVLSLSKTDQQLCHCIRCVTIYQCKQYILLSNVNIVQKSITALDIFLYNAKTLNGGSQTQILDYKITN